MVAPGSAARTPHVPQLLRNGAAAPLTLSSWELLASYHACGSGAERALIAVRCSEEAVVKSATYREIAWHFGVLGWTAVSSWRPVRLFCNTC